VDKLDAFSSMVASLIAKDPRIKPLVFTIMSLTASGEELWGRQQQQFRESSEAPLDTAFRSVACALSGRLVLQPLSGESFSLSETADTIHLLWLHNPAARNPIPPQQICELMRIASKLLQQDPTEEPSPLLKLGQLVIDDNVMLTTLAADLVPRLAADAYDLIPFQIHDSIEA